MPDVLECFIYVLDSHLKLIVAGFCFLWKNRPRFYRVTHLHTDVLLFSKMSFYNV